MRRSARVVAACVAIVGASAVAQNHDAVGAGAPSPGPETSSEAPRVDAAARLLEGVRKIASPGVPGPIAVFGETAFPVVAARDGDRRYAIVAGATHGSGRVVLFGHGGYLTHEALAEGQTDVLLLNAMRWCAGKRERPIVACWRVGAAASVAEERGLLVRRHEDATLDDVLDGADVVVFDSVRLKTAADAAKIRRFVERGGGAVCAGLGWGYLATTRGKSLRDDHLGNAAFGPIGLAFADGYADSVEDPAAATASLESLHALFALRRLSDAEARDDKPHPTVLAGLAAAVERAATVAPPAPSPFRRELAAYIDAAGDAPPPTESRPLHASKAAARLKILMERTAEDVAATESRPAHEAAADFPGAVADEAPRVAATFESLRTAPGGWTSLGLYAPPGGRITATLAPPEAARGRRLRIGAHTDLLWGSTTWRRHPDVSRVFEFDGETLSCASPFGGLVYVESPERGAVEVASLKVDGCVAAPRFVRGETSEAAFRAALLTTSAPWGEIEANTIVLTAKTEVLRGVNDPEALVAFWDDAVALYADLKSEPSPKRPWRVVNDVQISIGYMHSGYPIMTHLDVGPTMVDVASLRDDRKGWGFWHELGHNHQESDWTFEGTTETTCNIFTLRVVEAVSGIPPMKALERRGVFKAAREHLAAGAPYEKWKADPFLSIVMYAQVIDAFGFDAMRRAFKAYRDAPASRRPRNDAEKRDRWLIRLSEATGRNLGPFFRAWGVPVSDAAAEAVAALPPWTPPPL